MVAHSAPSGCSTALPILSADSNAIDRSTVSPNRSRTAATNITNPSTNTTTNTTNTIKTKMLYPNLQLNLSKVSGKKRPRYLCGGDEASNELADSNNNLELGSSYFDKLPTPSIDTPKILAMVDDMSQEKLFGQFSSAAAAALAVSPISSSVASSLSSLMCSSGSTSTTASVATTGTLEQSHSHIQLLNDRLRSVSTSANATVSNNNEFVSPLSTRSGTILSSSTTMHPHHNPINVGLLHVSESLQTPVVDVNQGTLNPFFSTLISPMDNYSCVPPNEVLGFSHAPAPSSSASASFNSLSTSISQSSLDHDTLKQHIYGNSNDLMQNASQRAHHEQPQMQMTSTGMTGTTNASLATSNSQPTTLASHHTVEYAYHHPIAYSNYGQLNTYSSSAAGSGQLQPLAGGNMNSSNNSNTIAANGSISYTELKPRTHSDTSVILQQQQQSQGSLISSNSNEQQLGRSMGTAQFGDEILIPNTITDQLYSINTCASRNSYSLAPSPCPSNSSQTSNSTMDTKCGEMLKYSDYDAGLGDCGGSYSSSNLTSGNTAHQLRLGQLHAAAVSLGKSPTSGSTKRPGSSSSTSTMDQLHLLKKSRMTKKQKFDAMMSEEKNLIQDNDHLRKEIIELERKIGMYRNSLMDVVKRGASK